MSSGRGRGNRNGGRRVQGQSDTNRPSNYGGLVKTVCDATSWPKEDVEKALAENDWNPDSTVDAILAGVHGMPTQEWHQVGKPKKKPTQPSGSQSEGYKGSRRAAPTITQSEGGNGGKGAPNEKRGKTPRAGFSKKPPTATPPAAAPVKVQAAPDAAAAESHPQPASAPAPSVNKWASGAPSFQPKKPEPAPPAPVEHVQPKPVADLKAEPPQPEPVPEPKVVESAPVSPEPAPVPVPAHVERPSPVAAPVVEQKQPEAAGVELPGSVAAEVDPKLQFSRAKPAGDSRLGSKIELSELMSGSQEYPPEMQHMILPPGGPDMPPYMFYNPGFPPHAFDPQAHAEGDKSKEGEAGNHGPAAPYMPYPFYPPYYPPYGMGQFGGQPQYFPPSMYKQAFPFPQGFSEDGQAPPMQFYGFPMYAPPPHAGQSEGQFDGQSHGDWGQQHPAIPPMMMAPRFPGGFHQGPGQGQPGQQGQRGNRQ